MASPKFQALLTGIRKGTILNVSYRRPMKMKKGMPVLYRVVTRQVKVGTQYDNHKTVIEDRIQGVRPEENAGLNGVEWVLYPYILKNSSGEFQYRFDCEGCAILSSHYEDEHGQQVAKEVAKQTTYASEFPNYDDLPKPIVFNIKEQHLTHIKAMPVAEIAPA